MTQIVPVNTICNEAPGGFEVQTYQFGDVDVRVIVKDGEPWFVAADVAAILGLSNPHSSLALLDGDERGVHTVETPSGTQLMAIMSESGLYNLILRSRKPEAKPFRKWVTAEILPSIRRTGGYSMTAALPSYPAALRQLADTLEAKEQADEALALATPKAEAFDALMDSTSTYLVREAAKLLSIGQNRLYTFMRQHQMIIPGTCEPYQDQVDRGRLVVKTLPYMRGTQQASSKTTYVTTKGLEYLRRKLAEEGVAA